MSYFTLEDIERYKKYCNKEVLAESDYLDMANYFGSCAVTALSNEIYNLMTQQDCEKMIWGLETGCRCLSCYTWQFIDDNGNVVKEVETLKKLIEKK